MKQGVDERDLSQTGWAVIFPQRVNPEVLRALRPLLEHRRHQAAAVSPRRYREFAGPAAYRRGESKTDFLRRHGAGPGPVDPDVVPYYVLLVADPTEIPFSFQSQLDIQRAVGRIHFETIAEYERYAANVLAAERLGPVDHADLTIVAARNDDDGPTAVSADDLVAPLVAGLSGGQGRWRIRSHTGSTATKEAVLRALEEARPDVLFTATHGVAFPSGHVEQRSSQGALVCQDWPGPGHPVERDHRLSAGDILEADVDLTGSTAFLFACFGVGTPATDAYAFHGVPATLAPQPFISALPQALLGRERGAQAVIGHVDRAWSCSFSWPGAGTQIEVYRSTLDQLSAGYPVGAAMEYMSDRYAELSSDLEVMLDDIRMGQRAKNQELAGLWVASADARNFMVFGDPAVRLPGRLDQVAARRRAPGAAAIQVGSTTAGGPVPPVALAERATAVDTAPLEAEPEVVPEAAPVAVATYTCDDPAGVQVDPRTGRITGASLRLMSHMHLDGSATHVVGLSAADQLEPHEAQLVLEVHTRMVELSLSARRERGPDADHRTS